MRYQIVTLALLGCLHSGCAVGTTPTAVPAVNLADLASKVELRLVANKDTCTISPADPNGMPAGSAVDMTLELHNRSAEPVVIPVGTADWYVLKLEGPGAREGSDMSMWCMPLPDLTLDGGKNLTVELRHLRYSRGKGRILLCTKPGEYTLTAEARVRVEGHEVTVCSAPVRFTAVEGKPELPRADKPLDAKPAIPATAR